MKADERCPVCNRPTTTAYHIVPVERAGKFCFSGRWAPGSFADLADADCQAHAAAWRADARQTEEIEERELSELAQLQRKYGGLSD